MSLGLILILVALAVGLALLVRGLADPLTARLGLRNVMRHRRQTFTVIVGLLAGTAVIGASLVTGDSLEAGLRQTAIDGLGETDVVVHVPGNLYVPRGLFDEMVAPPRPAALEGASALILDTAAVEHEAEDLYEPNALVMGFDVEEDRPFGAFRDAATGETVYGEDLGSDGVYLNARVADKIGASAGDAVRLTYRQPFVPFVPELTWLNGTLVAAGAAPDGAGGYTYTHSPEDTYQTTIEVPQGSVGLFAVVAWPDPTNSTDLDLELIDPNGRSFRSTNGSFTPAAPAPLPLPPLPPAPGGAVSEPQNPAFLHVDEANTTAGTWTFEVHGKNARNQFYTSFVAVLVPEYDLERAVRFFEDIDERFGGELGDTLDPRSGRGGGETTTLEVRRVVAMEGKGVFFRADAVFMTRETAERLYGVEGLANWLKVTNVGGPEEGLASTTEVVRFLEERQDALRSDPLGHPPGAVDNLAIEPFKQEFLAQTEEAAQLFTQFLTLIGSFTLIAGVMLIVNIFSMLAEERRHELGIARAVGLTRKRLILAFTFEGSLYTLAAAALGVLAGMGLAGFLVWGINSLAPPDSGFHIPYRAEPLSLAVAFAAGALITFATVLFASWRAAHLNIVRAIRDLDAPARGTGRLWPRVLLLGILFGATVAGTLFGSYLALVLGPALTAFAAGPVLSRVWRPTVAWKAIAIAVIIYVLVGFLLFPGPDTLERDISTVARGVVLVIAATVLLVETEAGPRSIAWLLSRSQTLAPIARVATTYPLHRRFRTGLTLSMYALVIFIIVVFSVFFAMFTPDISRETGGYHVTGESQVPVEDLRTVAGVDALIGTPEDPFLGVAHHDVLADRFEFGSERILIDGGPPRGFQTNSARFVGFDEDFAAENGFPLDTWDPAYGATEQEVYARVANDPSLVLVSYALVGNLSAPDGRAHGPGATLTINTTGGRSDHTIVGIMEQTFFGGVWMQKAEVARLFPEYDGLYLFRLDEGVDQGDAAKRIERAFRPIGMDADDVESEAAELEAETTRIYQLFQAYLGLGLIVGVASIGIVTSRAVLERRREIGMLKAIGFTRRMVAMAFLTEVLVILAAAVIIGLGMGIAVARLIYLGELGGIPGVHWTIPWGRIVQMLSLAVVATFIATLWPAQRASQVPAAEALRTTE